MGDLLFAMILGGIGLVVLVLLLASWAVGRGGPSADVELDAPLEPVRYPLARAAGTEHLLDEAER